MCVSDLRSTSASQSVSVSSPVGNDESLRITFKSFTIERFVQPDKTAAAQQVGRLGENLSRDDENQSTIEISGKPPLKSNARSIVLVQLQRISRRC